MMYSELEQIKDGAAAFVASFSAVCVVGITALYFIFW
jgi:hypothetical protein